MPGSTKVHKFSPTVRNYFNNFIKNSYKTSQVMKQNEEFKINFNVYSSKRLHQPQLYNGARKMQKIQDFNKSNLYALKRELGPLKSFSDDKLQITSVKRSPRMLNSEKKPSKLRRVEMSEKVINSQDPSFVDQQIEELKQLVKTQAKSIREKGQMLPNRPEFPIRFVAKPFVHYGNTAKVAAKKRKDIDDVVKANDNQMKLYIGLMKKDKDSEKLTIGKINNGLRSSKVELTEEAQEYSGISENMHKINIETRDRLDDDEIEHKTPVKSTLLSHEYNPNHLIPILQSSLNNSLSKFNDSVSNQQHIFQEMSDMNKTIFEKNGEHVPKQAIITSIRKFDDRC